MRRKTVRRAFRRRLQKLAPGRVSRSFRRKRMRFVRKGGRKG